MHQGPYETYEDLRDREIPTNQVFPSFMDFLERLQRVDVVERSAKNHEIARLIRRTFHVVARAG